MIQDLTSSYIFWSIVGAFVGSTVTAFILAILHDRSMVKYGEKLEKEFIKIYEPVLEKTLTDLGNKIIDIYSESLKNGVVESVDEVLKCAKGVEDAIAKVVSEYGDKNNIEEIISPKKVTLH